MAEVCSDIPKTYRDVHGHLVRAAELELQTSLPL